MKRKRNEVNKNCYR